MAIRVRGKLYPSPGESLPRNQQLATKPQAYLTSYRYTCLPQARSPSKITLFTARDQSRIKNRKKVDIFLIPVLEPLQVQKAISYHLNVNLRATSVKIPKRITPCPLIDAIVELRFESDLLPDAIFGIIYQKIKSGYPEVDKLPILQLPDEVRFKDPNLKYNPYYKLTSQPFVVQIGPKVLTVSCPGEYIGWVTFFPKILETFAVLQELSIVGRVVRLGIRYINYFEFDIHEKINLRLMLKDELLQSNQAMIRAKIQDGQFINTLQIANNVTVAAEEKIMEGSIIDIDTHLDKQIEDFFANMQNLITEGHETEKRLFFSLLKDEFLETLNPEYCKE